MCALTMAWANVKPVTPGAMVRKTPGSPVPVRASLLAMNCNIAEYSPTSRRDTGRRYRGGREPA